MSKCTGALAFKLPARQTGMDFRVDFAVKNTFIEIDDFSDDDGFESDCKAIRNRRQLSEPVFSLACRLKSDDEDRTRREDELKSSTTGSTAGEAESELPRQAGDANSETQQQQQQQQQQDHDRPAMSLNLALAPFHGQGYLDSGAGEAMTSQCALLWAAPLVMAMQGHTTWASTSEGIEPVVTAGYFSGDEMEPVDDQEMELVPEVACPPEGWAAVTTLMVRNLPNRYTQQMLLEEICDAGFAGSFDFLYLPIDSETNANKGYAFINLTDSEGAWRFKTAFEDKKMARFNSSKFVMVSPAALQGLDANYAHYSKKRCNRGDPASRPLFLREPTRGRGGARSRVTRRGGQRHREKGRSLVDMAAQKMQEEQSQTQRLRPVAAAKPDCAAWFCTECGNRAQGDFRRCQFCGAACPAHGTL